MSEAPEIIRQTSPQNPYPFVAITVLISIAIADFGGIMVHAFWKQNCNWM